MQIFQVDAFTDELFRGNPAAVVPMNEWLDDELMQNIAAENNLAETAFFVPREGGGFQLRWFTPTVEVQLCGHATLATAHVLFKHLDYLFPQISFFTKSGELIVKKSGEDAYTMDFPTDQIIPAIAPPIMIEALGGITPQETFTGRDDYLLIFENQSIIEQIQPDFKKLAQVESRGCIISAPGDEVDFVSRGFFPQSGIDEDPVTGSAHTTLTPYWSPRLGKIEMVARQLSKRGGEMTCTFLGTRVELTGKAKTYLTGQIKV